MRDKAQNALKQAKDGAAVSALTAENTKLRLEVDRLSKQVTELASGVNSTVSEDAISAAIEKFMASKGKSK
jgi:cell division protein FtsB